MDNDREILVFPRLSLPTLAPFIPWKNASTSFKFIEEGMDWVSREKAELSADLFQPIPCAIVRNDLGEYCVLRRIKEGREDLRSKVSLVVGGHVDRCDETTGLSSLLLSTLKREVKEELGVESLSGIMPIGMVMDHSSVIASRHVGFVYELVISEEFKPQATEEFSADSILNRRLYAPTELSKFREEFDPWSFIIFAEYISTSFVPTDVGSQPAFSFTWNT